MPKMDLKQEYRAEDGTLYRRGKDVEVPDSLAKAIRGQASTAKPRAAAGDLPEDFPGREALLAGGFDSVAKVSAASDEDLKAVKGIGPTTLKEIRQAMK